MICRYAAVKVVSYLSPMCASQYILKIVNGNGTNVFNVPANGAERRLLFRIEKVTPGHVEKWFISLHSSANLNVFLMSCGCH